MRDENVCLRDQNDRLRSKNAEACGTIEVMKFKIHELSREYSEDQHDISEEQHDILKCIAHLGPTTQKWLEEDLNLNLGAVYPNLDALQDIKYISVNAKFRWYLSQAGIQHLARCGSFPEGGIQMT